MLSWSEIRTLDFSGSTKPWHVLAASQQFMMQASNSNPDIDMITIASQVLDQAVPGGGNGQRRPFVDLYTTLWIQWLGAYHNGCKSIFEHMDFDRSMASSSPFCQFHPVLENSFPSF
eukprot:CAMPEP_0114401558 /NCGR_PEP_ID=MMETSP0102-20121206/17309_1 /TAXON_ID=38822 ORGANISM="Pteridomonas danica, Strain PT" /NCGR_SAMPLE_ID=MMETSP0102 /ASSEMBLY_ACC=CAM_ASM_000212 /LENGTH=116 /DNA_ID=CAMNT_0001564639 /DNA_START=169 /DNA_END=519 /DNA_ORIENTATION=+